MIMKNQLITICLLLLIALNFSCKTRKIETNNSTVSNTKIEQSDSTVIEKTVTPIVTPASSAELNVTPEDLQNLPVGSEFQNKSGNATVSAKKEKDGSLTITANCDSLILLVENLKIENFHFKKENTELKAKVETKETKIIKEPSGWQWFQIKGFWVLLISILLYIVFRILKRRFNKWIDVPYKSI